MWELETIGQYLMFLEAKLNVGEATPEEAEEYFSLLSELALNE